MEGLIDGTINTSNLRAKGFAMVDYGSDAQLLVRFLEMAVLQEFESSAERQNRPIYAPKTMVEIHLPGGKDVIKREATDADKERFHKQYEFFKRQGEKAEYGTPLEELTFLDVCRRAELKAIKIMSAEQLAAVDDMTLQKIGPGGRDLKAKAAAYLKAAEDQGFVQKQESRILQLGEKLAELDEVVKEQAARLKEYEHGKEKGQKGRT